AAFLYRYQGRPSFTPPSSSPFSDMRTSSKFYKEVTWLRSTRITTGYADGTFRPKGSVTREATAAFLYRLAGRPDVNVPSIIPKSFTVSGAGFGHGVGMSQYGAQGMAVEGYGAGSILEHYFTGTQVSTVNADRDVRVEIFGSGSDAHNAVDIIARGDWRMRFYTSPTAYTQWTGTSGERLKVTRTGNSVRVTRADGTSAVATRDVVFHWENTQYYNASSTTNATVELYRAGTNTRATHGTYRHGRIFISVPSTTTPRLIVSNELKLNTEYLYGIAEVPSSWHLNTLQAQAIVARGYALKNMGSLKATCNCHLYDDTRSQHFTGWNKENEGASAQWGARWVDAVNRTTSSNATQGKVLTHNGTIATTYYFSSTGGRTENSEHIWSATVPYLKAVDDRWSLESRNPNRAWTRTITQAQARTMFGLSDVVSITVAARTSSSSQAAASRVTARSSTGQTASINGPETIRSRVVGGQSPWIWSFTANY
ncbi:MAG: SpoIID/LytB domain-containing protein, partial [Demequina sp.]